LCVKILIIRSKVFWCKLSCFGAGRVLVRDFG
jgi:hypothetical protein